ncbi:MAG: glycerol-3-phosphate dehydrogenase, partial [Proteobacteria bacterium]|nr:glycerol-3-phosphate dehydrogenase [Pseudomonadota bacterium]
RARALVQIAAEDGAGQHPQAVRHRRIDAGMTRHRRQEGQAERMAIREALGYGAPHFPLADHYDNDRWMYGDAHKKLTDSGDWRERIDLHTHRYMLEDTALGLAFLASVARHAGVDAPVAHGLLVLAGAILGRDLHKGTRTLDALGLAPLSRAQLQTLLRTGAAA